MLIQKGTISVYTVNYPKLSLGLNIHKDVAGVLHPVRFCTPDAVVWFILTQTVFSQIFTFIPAFNCNKLFPVLFLSYFYSLWTVIVSGTSYINL